MKLNLKIIKVDSDPYRMASSHVQKTRGRKSSYYCTFTFLIKLTDRSWLMSFVFLNEISTWCCYWTVHCVTNLSHFLISQRTVVFLKGSHIVSSPDGSCRKKDRVAERIFPQRSASGNKFISELTISRVGNWCGAVRYRSLIYVLYDRAFGKDYLTTQGGPWKCYSVSAFIPFFFSLSRFLFPFHSASR